MDKSPISILQEYAVAKRLPLPNYHILSEGNNFRCIVTIENFMQDANAANKKRAKHIAAEKLIKLLTNEGMMGGSTNVTYASSTETESTVITNSVGELNEFSSRTGIEYPIYDITTKLIGVVSNEFVCKCKLDRYETKGTGKSKKEAKQVAAKRMLDIATSSNNNSWKIQTRPSLSLNKISYSVPKDNQTIIELFKKLSFYCRYKVKGCTQDALQKKILTETEIEHLLKEAHDEPSLRYLLANLGITYTIWKFQTNPLVMCIKTESSDYLPFTFLQNGINKSEITVKLLRKVVDSIAVHI